MQLEYFQPIGYCKGCGDCRRLKNVDNFVHLVILLQTKTNSIKTWRAFKYREACDSGVSPPIKQTNMIL